MDDFGMDGEFADDKICPQHSGKYCPPNVRSSAIGQAILTANASLIETAMTGYATFRLNFHRFDRFELDLRGRTHVRGAALSCLRLKSADIVLL